MLWTFPKITAKPLPGLILLLSFCFMCPDIYAGSFQQQPDANGRVEGRLSGENASGLTGATIKVEENKMTLKTGADGSFSLALPAGTYTFTFTYVSYKETSRKVKVEAGKTTRLSVTLEPQAGVLSDVVVTALGITQEKKQLGYAAQVVSGDDINVAKSTNMFSALQGKVAGMNMNQSSTGIMNTSKITLRGESSLNFGNNQALIVVDGVPINNGVESAQPQDVVVDYGTGGADINPDDVESVTVLKGPNASALYGSRAAFGVIIIKTKSASRSKDLGVSVTASAVWDNALKLPDFQNEYGAGSNNAKYYAWQTNSDGAANFNTNNGWGPKFDGQMFVQYGAKKDDAGNWIKTPWVAHPDNVKDYYVTGKTYNTGVSLAKAGDIGDVRASYNFFKQTGILENTGLQRHQVNTRTKLKLSKGLTFDANINYMKVISDNLPVADYGNSPTYNMIFAQRNMDLQLLRDYWQPGQENIKQQHLYSFVDNPYLMLYEELNTLSRDRVFGNMFVNYEITPHLTVMVRTGLDYQGDYRTSRLPFSSTRAATGLYRVQNRSVSERNSDFLVSYSGDLNKDFKYKVSGGGNSMVRSGRDISNLGTILLFPGIYNLRNASTISVTQANYDKSINSLYAFGNLSYKDMIFMEITGRNDWSSTLPEDNNSYFYPSVSISAVLSDLLPIKTANLNFLKLRSSYASVGSDTDPYQIYNVYSYGALSGTVVVPASIPSNTLKPEMNNSFEIGLEGAFLQNRLKLDYSYYKSVSRNQILKSPIAASSGYTTRVFNAGQIDNYGMELSITGTIVKSKQFTWTAILNGSFNRNKIVSLAEGVDSYNLASFNSTRNGASGFITATVGGSMGDIYGIGFERDPDGNIVYVNGLPQRTTQIAKLGNYNPKYIAGLTNTFTYKNYSIKILVDGKVGGQIYSITHGLGSEFGTLKNTLPGREEGIVGEGVTKDSDGKYVPNTVNVPAYSYYNAYYKRPNVEANLFDASFLKVREVIIGYGVPKRYLEKVRIKSARINLVGRNLLLFTKVPDVDPEAIFFSASSGIVPGVDNVSLPTTRSMGINLQLNF